MSMYCTKDEAKSAGATGSVAELDAAIVEASARVDRYTGELFAPTALTLTLDVDGEGVAYVRKHVKTITSVSWHGIASPIVSTGYRIVGDRIELAGVLGWADVTILGAEPWNGGFANLSTMHGREPRVIVDGVFGWDAPFPDVSKATAVIAAAIRGSDTDSEVPTTHADEEGNVLPVIRETPVQLDRVPLRSRTTGSARADSLLAPYIREPVRIRA